MSYIGTTPPQTFSTATSQSFSGYGAQSCNINTMDSPSTTSAINYKLQYAEEFGGTAYVYDGATFMAMEIAG